MPAIPATFTPTFYNDLDATLEATWAQLARGVNDRRSPFHTPTLGTIARDGSPSVRTVILRGIDAAERRLRFHTDRRSAKAVELKSDPRVAMHFYDAGQKIQLRVAGTAHVHAGDATAQAAWQKSQVMSRACYTQALPPGAAIGDPASLPQLAGVPDGAETGFENFAAVVITVRSIDWLYLGSQGHRRAQFEWPDGVLRKTWLAP